MRGASCSSSPFPCYTSRRPWPQRSFYCQKLGFTRQFATRFDTPDPCYLGVTRDDARLHLSSFSGDAVLGGVAFILVDDVDALHAELAAKGVAIELSPTDQTWGNREMCVRDPDGNSLRFVRAGER
ncbi:MAG: bleomycin resistance protein [Pirellulales bacterium]